MTPTILCLDTTTPALSVALLHQDSIDEYYQWAPRQHNQLLLPSIDTLLKKQGLHLSDLSAIAFTHGPGSFTGVRLGMSVVQGLCLATELPVISLSSLQVLAQAAYRLQQAERVFVALDARMGEVYWGRYALSQAKLMQPLQSDSLAKPTAISLDQAELYTGIGSGIDAYSTVFCDTLNTWIPDQHPHAVDIATLALDAFKHGQLQTIDMIKPTYLRDTVVT